ncbi:hypothetical protein HDU76_002447 [Blyttiomyces sp. JEL0837]|nr:hypothetical protein HDU76_002447 [Blyttiomyces sp. JEL0837]
MSAQVPTIVVIGGSYAGTAVIKKIDSTLGNQANIILIEERDSFYITLAAVRAVSERNFINKILVPYTSLFQKNQNSKVIHARATELHEHHVVLNSGETVNFDYCVIATGSSTPAPMKPLSNKKEVAIAKTNEIVDAVTKAKSVLIVGGGPIGIEVAGEIATDHPNVKVTLIHAGSELLNTVTNISPKARAQALSTLKSLNVEVILNEKVLPSNGSILPNNEGYHLGSLTLKTNTGRELTSDVQFLATGNVKVNSEIVRTLATGGFGDIIDEKGFVKVLATGQLNDSSLKHIFALGDVSNLDKFKLAYLAGKVQAPLIADNIISIVKNPSGPTKLKNYTPFAMNVLILSIGRKGGMVQLPFGVFGNWTARNMKSTSLFVPDYWATLNVANQLPK